MTRVGATAFHCERRCRVLLRDIFRFGTATVSLLRRWAWPLGQVDVLVPAGHSVFLLVGLGQRTQRRPPRVDRRVVPVVGIVREPRSAVGAQPGTVVLAQRLER